MVGSFVLASLLFKFLVTLAPRYLKVMTWSMLSLLFYRCLLPLRARAWYARSQFSSSERSLRALSYFSDNIRMKSPRDHSCCISRSCFACISELDSESQWIPFASTCLVDLLFVLGEIKVTVSRDGETRKEKTKRWRNEKGTDPGEWMSEKGRLSREEVVSPITIDDKLEWRALPLRPRNVIAATCSFSRSIQISCLNCN